MGAVVSYGNSKDAFLGYTVYLKQLIESRNLVKICDIGGGANPQLDANYIRNAGLDYTLLDISAEELKKAPDMYKKVVQDITAAPLPDLGKFDLAFTKMLAEHVKDGRQLHLNVHAILREGGYAVHFFPTLYTFPFLVNKLIPEHLTGILLNIFSPRDQYKHTKFPAYYSWCRGPIPGLINKFENLGYKVVEYRGYYGHGYYRRIPLVRELHGVITRYQLKHPNPYLTSFAIVILQKVQ